jgi:DNA-binding IclR family transcriptional regulator
VRRTGIAVNDEELQSALRSIAVPVRSRSGEVVAAVNVSIPWSPGGDHRTRQPTGLIRYDRPASLQRVVDNNMLKL